MKLGQGVRTLEIKLTREGEMERKSKFVIPRHAMHFVHRGNNRKATFYVNEDYRKYIDRLFSMQIRVNV